MKSKTEKNNEYISRRKNMEEKALYYSLKYGGHYQKIYDALINDEAIDEKEKEQLFQQMKCRYTTIYSQDYPEKLKTINYPPIVLYYYGDLSLVDHQTIGIVGRREVDDYGIKVTKELSGHLSKAGYTIVSGLAKGVDGIAHKEAIKQGGKTIAILGSGIDYCYPLRHQHLYNEIKNNHLLMSEYPLLSQPQKHKFPFRNRIVAGLSDSILVTQAHEKSGTLITVGYALEQGKDVYCVPSRIDDPKGCNLMIQQGAKLVMNVMDIIEEKDLWLTK